MIQLLRILMCFSFLIYASYHDFKTMMVPNKIWPPMIAIGITLMSADIFMNETKPLYTLAAFAALILAASTLVYVLFELGAFGGADAKAIISLTILAPEFVLGAFMYAYLLLGVLFVAPLIHIIFKTGIREGWATIKNYKVPFIPALTVGLLISIIYGNILFEVI